jgi:hypothetical protein
VFFVRRNISDKNSASGPRAPDYFRLGIMSRRCTFLPPVCVVGKSCFSLSLSLVRAELIIEFCARAHSPQRENSSMASHRSDKSNNKESLSLATHIDFSCASLFKRRTVYSQCSKAENRLWLCNFSSPFCICFLPFLWPPFVYGWGLPLRERERWDIFIHFLL